MCRAVAWLAVYTHGGIYCEVSEPPAVTHRSDVRFIEYVVVGLGVGLAFGMFGAGGSAFATPVLALIGVPGLLAVASPLPAMLPAAFLGARRYLRAGFLDVRIARYSVIGGVPGALLGALVSRWVGGDRLLVMSGVLLLVLGIRMALPDRSGAAARAVDRQGNVALVVVATCGVGFLTGLLANGGGFLLVPLFVLVLGLGTATAAGTSMVVVGVLTVPTLFMHSILGHIDWTVALGFALGLIPASFVGGRIARSLPDTVTRVAFGSMLVVFSLWFLVHQLS